MPDLHGWITQHINRVERDARDAEKENGREWTTQWDERADAFRIVDGINILVANQMQPSAAALIARHDPAAVLRRCEADRKILARHRLDPDAFWARAAMCEGCGTYGEFDDPETENLNDCPELLDLAHAHGITDEILAGLDRPKEGERPEPTRQSLVPNELIEASQAGVMRHILGTRPVEPRPEVKALEILEPELKKISAYVPVSEEQP